MSNSFIIIKYNTNNFSFGEFDTPGICQLGKVIEIFLNILIEHI